MAKPANSGHPATGEGGGAADAARLRDEIDRGGAGDKVAFADPSAAPLGTDDEAAGTAPTMEQVRHARAQETARADAAEIKDDPGDLQGRSAGRRNLLTAVAVIAVLALILLIVWLV